MKFFKEKKVHAKTAKEERKGRKAVRVLLLNGIGFKPDPSPPFSLFSV
jgi:hypothetical protein